MTQSSGRGHRLVPHTADVILEAWAPDRAGCFEEVSFALVESFASPSDIGSASPAEPRDVAVAVETVESLIEEIIFLLDTEGVLPLTVACDGGDEGTVSCRLRVLPLEAFEMVGAVPKAVSHSGLQFEARPEGWWCRALIDV